MLVFDRIMMGTLRALRSACFCLIFGLLCSCSAPINASFPTPLPTEIIPTVIALTVQALKAEDRSGESTISVTEIPIQVATIPSITATLSPTPPHREPTFTAEPVTDIIPLVSLDTLPPDDIPIATIQIISPGNASRVTSPIQVNSLLNAGPKGVMRIELLGEDGRLLMRDVTVDSESQNKVISLMKAIKFEIPSPEEGGRLQICVEDEYGRNLAVASVDLILLSTGLSEGNPPGDKSENIIIDAPEAKTLIQGGVVRVSGRGRLRSDQPLRIELQTNSGNIVGSRQVAVTPIPGSSYGAFAVDVPFTISEPSRIRLLVWEPGDQIPGIVHLSSLEIMLSP